MTYQSGDLILNKYRVDTLIGEGACGEVYRVINVADKAQRAIKVFSQGTIGTGNLGFFNCRQRFRFEFQLAARLNTPEINPYLLQIYDFVDTTECMVFEMEYAPGGSLRSKMLSYTQKGIAYPREKALRVAIDVAVGLGTLHRSGIVHHNIKATNILFNLRDRIVFSDLGLAQGIGQFENSSILNYSNPSLDPNGTINLDRRLASDFASPTTDIYALGHILFEMITGKDYSKQPPHTRLGDFIPGIKPSLDDLLSRMLHESSGLKELDASTVARELQRELEAEEQAQREILSRKYDELAEWERLKNTELSRQKGSAANQPTRPVSETKEKIKLEQPKDVNRSAEVTAPDYSDEVEKPVVNGKKSPEPVESEIQPDAKSGNKDIPATQRSGIEVSRKGSLILTFVVLLIVAAGFIYWRFFLPQAAKTPTSIPVNPAIQPTAEPQLTEEPGSEPTFFELIATQPANVPTIDLPASSNPTPIPTTAAQPSNTVPSSIRYFTENPGFEDVTGWDLKIGDSHILGKYTGDWASEGSKSYKIYMIGDANYEYCFISGIRTTINQNVDLTDVDDVLFDMNFKSGTVTKDSQGNPVRTKAVAFIDGEQVYLSNENTNGQQFDQTISLNKRYPGKHDLKFGLMTTYHFCVKGRNEDSSLTLFIDNIRLITK
jgi:serine/threonine protein kinase